MRPFLLFTWIEAKLYLRNFYSPFFALAFPVMLLLLFGSIWGDQTSTVFGVSVIQISTAAFTGIVVAVNGLMNFPLNLAAYRERKVLKRLRITPASPGLLLSAHVAVNVMMTVLGVVLLVGVSVLAYGTELPAQPLPVIASLALSLASMLSIGLLIGSVVAQEKGASVIANIVYFPMIFLSGATLPSQFFPEGLKRASDILPLTHGVTIVRGTWIGNPLSDYPTELWVLAAVTVLFTGAALLLFRWE